MQLYKGSKISKVDKFLLNFSWKIDQNQDVSYGRSHQSKNDKDIFYDILFTHDTVERNVVYERSFKGWQWAAIQALSANLAGMA